MDKSRQQFEEWFAPQKEEMMRNVLSMLLIRRMRRRQLSAWQASRDSLEVELPYKHQPKFYSYEDGINTGLNMCRDILISNGVKIKDE